MNLVHELQHAQLSQTTRRLFLQECAAGLGAAWLPSAASSALRATSVPAMRDAARPLAPVMPPLPATAKRVIYLHMAGSPSQLDLFDYKPELQKLDGQDCPQEFIAGKRFALPHSRIMMHQPLGGIQGQAADIAIQAEQMIYVKKMLAERIAFHTGQTAEQINTDSDRDRWFTADEAKDYGIIDNVIIGKGELA